MQRLLRGADWDTREVRDELRPSGERAPMVSRRPGWAVGVGSG